MAEFAGMMSGQSPEPTPPAEDDRCVCYEHPDVAMVVRLALRLPQQYQRRVAEHLLELHNDGEGP